MAVNGNNTVALSGKPDALAAKGLVLSGLGQYNEAIRYFDRALAIDGNNTDILFMKGAIFYILGQYNETIKYLDRALAIDGNNTDALAGKGLVTL